MPASKPNAAPLELKPATAAKPKISKWDPSVVLFGLERGKAELVNSISEFLRPANEPTPPDRTSSVKMSEYVLLEPAEDDETIPLTSATAGTRSVLSNRDRKRHIKLYNCNSNVISQLADEKMDPEVVKLREELRQEMRQADMLICAVTAHDADNDNLKTFGLFRDFVTQINLQKQRAREVGLYPVLIVITECDELREDSASVSDWLRRIIHCKRKARKEFNEVFQRRDDRPKETDPDPIVGFGFGTIDLKVWGLTVKEETVLDSEGHPIVRSPKQLFSDACAVAENYRLRMLKTRKRLQMTVSGATVMVASMFLGALLLIAFGGLSETDILAERIRGIRETEGSPEVRYADKRLPQTLRDLKQIRKSKGFDQLPENLRQFVLDREDEAEAYQDYRRQFNPPRLGPPEVRTRKQLDNLDTALDTTLEPPEQYGQSWNKTDAVKLWNKWQTDEKLLEEAESQLNDYFRGLIRRANELLLVQMTPDHDWWLKVEKLFADAKALPFSHKQPIPGSPQLPLLRGQPLTYDAAYRFDRVDQAFTDWRETVRKLGDLRGLSDVLGLTGSPDIPPILDLPEPGSGISTEKLAAARLADLNHFFPQQTERSYSDWVIDNFPDAVRNNLARILDQRIATGSRHVVEWIESTQSNVVLRTKAGREQFAEQLVQDPVVQEWGRLLQLLQHCRGVELDEANPVTELVGFLRQEIFPIDLPALELTLPDDLRARRAQPSSALVIEYTPQGGTTQKFRYTQEGSGRPDRPVTRYTFKPEGRRAAFDYKPGDRLTANLEIRAGGDRFDLIWAQGPNTLYQFDALVSPPIVKKAGPISAEESAPGVHLELREEGQLPRLPRLYPRLAAQ